MSEQSKKVLEWTKLQADIIHSTEYKGWTCLNCGAVLRLTFTEYGRPDNRQVGFILHCPGCKITGAIDGKITIPAWWSEQYS